MVLAGISGPAELWQAELAWVPGERDGLRLLETSSLDRGLGARRGRRAWRSTRGGPGRRSRPPRGASAAEAYDELA